MSRTKFFENPYEEYKPGLGVDLKSSNVTKGLENKWNDTYSKLRQVETRDGSVYTGIAGIALLMLLRGPADQNNLKEILKLIKNNQAKRDHTFLCGSTGPSAIGAVVSHRLGLESECKAYVDKLLSIQAEAVDPRGDLPNEYLYGRAGYLFALLYVNTNVNPPPVPEGVVRKVVEAILVCGQREATSKFPCPLMWAWHGKYYLGAAHGVSGILYLLLQAKKYLTDTELQSLVKPTVDYLVTLRYESGNYPSSLGSDDDRLVQWCHGAPGFAYLFSIAYKVYKETTYLNLALEAGDVVWERGLLKKGYSICHGVSGNAYCFLELYQVTQDPKHLYRAMKFAEWCLDYTARHEEHYPDRPFSLYEGIAGPMYLLLDIQNPLEAKFPGFTL